MQQYTPSFEVKVKKKKKQQQEQKTIGKTNTKYNHRKTCSTKNFHTNKKCKRKWMNDLHDKARWVCMCDAEGGDTKANTKNWKMAVTTTTTTWSQHQRADDNGIVWEQSTPEKNCQMKIIFAKYIILCRWMWLCVWERGPSWVPPSPLLCQKEAKKTTYLCEPSETM